MEKEEKKVIKPIQEVQSPEETMEKQQAAAVVTYVMGILAMFLSGGLILSLSFAIIGLVKSGQSKKVEKTSYRSLRLIGKIFAITALVIDIIIITTIIVIQILKLLIIAAIIIFLLITLVFGGLVVGAILLISALMAL